MKLPVLLRSELWEFEKQNRDSNGFGMWWNTRTVQWSSELTSQR